MKQKTKTESPPLVNHRWNLPSIKAMLDDMLPEWPEGKHPDFSGPDGYPRMRGAFTRLAEHLLSTLHWHLEKAAGRGIMEALELIQDPDYYETVKKRRSRSIAQGKKWRKEQDANDKERERKQRGELTEEERIMELGNIAYHLHYHQKEIEKLTARKAAVEGHAPVAFTKADTPRAPKLKNDDDDNSWQEIFE